MRQAGQLSNETDARKLVDFLLAEGIFAKADADGGAWTIWIINEAQLARGKEELAAFRDHPNDPRYAESAARADAVRRNQEARLKTYRKNVVEMRDRWRSPIGGNTLVTFALILGSIGVSIWTNFGSSDAPLVNELYINSIVDHGATYSWTRGLPDIRSGQVWRLVTPIFLHFSLWHVIGNMSWMIVLGPMLERRYGSLRFALLVLLIAVTSNLAQYYVDGPTFGGMSGVVFGLFGYVWIKGHFDPSSGMGIDRTNLTFMIIWFFLCMTGQVGNIANTAHGVGLAVGMVTGFIAARYHS